jgi:histidine kinase
MVKYSLSALGSEKPEHLPQSVQAAAEDALFNLAKDIFSRLLHSLSFKLSFTAGLIIFLAVSAAAWFNIQAQISQLEKTMESEASSFVDTVRRATYWSMLQNQRDSLHQIIQDVGRQPNIERVRVFNKDGMVMFSSLADEIGHEVDKKAEACYGCHSSDAPLARLPSGQTTRIFNAPDGERLLGIIRPIYNEPSCYTPACHAHPPEQQVLGVLDVNMNLAGLDQQMQDRLWQTLGFAAALFIGVSTFIGLGILFTVSRSVNRMVLEVDKVTEGQMDRVETVEAPDELGRVAQAFNRMVESVTRRNRAKDQRYRQLVTNSTDAVVVTDGKGRVIWGNPVANQLLGVENGYAQYQDIVSMVEPEERDGLLGAMRQAMETAEPTGIMRFNLHAADGKLKIIEGRFRPLEDEEGGTNLLANLRDITERESLEAELERRRNFERQLVRQALNAIIATDQGGLVQVFNESAERLFETTANEVIGQSDYTRFFPRAQVKLIQKSLYENPEDGGSLMRVLVVKTSNGKRLPVMLSARALYIKGVFSGVVMFLQNLRESKHLKAQLIRKTRLAAAGQTAAGLAHCLKNLLHGLGSATYLVDQGLSDQDLELTSDGWRMVKKNLDQMSALTQDLLSYARDRRPQYQAFNLNQLLHECSHLVDGRAKEAGVEIEIVADPGCGRVMLDPQGVRRVVLNLLTNSLDALAENPPDPGPARIELAAGRDGFGQVLISVSDNGPGLSPEARKRLFSGLFTSKGSKGTGLGLLVSQKIAEEHGGTLEFSNLSGGGVRFTLAMPDLAENGGQAQMPPEV